MIEPSNLKTLKQKPSWVNRAGRIDRSACVELSASEVWPHLEVNQWRTRRVPRNKTGCEADSTITIDARTLFQRHNSRLPHRLVGDLRTSKSNAMKEECAPRKAHGVKAHGVHAVGFPGHNPNKGASRTKKLGLWSGAEATYEHLGPWKQTLRIERWRLNPILAYHFLICPACKIKKKKLFMVLAMKQEIDDAEIAEGWIKILEARLAASRVPISPDLAAHRAALLDRYSMLFRSGGRTLICKKCLGVRYGEVKKHRRHEVREAALQRAHRKALKDAQRVVEREAESMAALEELGRLARRRRRERRK